VIPTSSRPPPSRPPSSYDNEKGHQHHHQQKDLYRTNSSGSTLSTIMTRRPVWWQVQEAIVSARPDDQRLRCVQRESAHHDAGLEPGHPACASLHLPTHVQTSRAPWTGGFRLSPVGHQSHVGEQVVGRPHIPQQDMERALGHRAQDVTKMCEFWSGAGMDMSCSNAKFQVLLKQVKDMTARREVDLSA